MGELSESPLGRAARYPERYDPGLLFAIDRATQRALLGFDGALPFGGVDLWTAYELSWLDRRRQAAGRDRDVRRARRFAAARRVEVGEALSHGLQPDAFR